ncbi:MAG: aminoacetone oxidase family FAD-binding enzyme [Bacteroidales bacterium]|nr:aminoacetone oxidase family FAD-binding enzyme [Candidatus Physcousia equi]
MPNQVYIIGAGAAGCFCAIALKRMNAHMEVTVVERGTRPLRKLAITGGGRCNLTNSFSEVRSLKQVYPRGEKLMKRLLKEFSQHDTMAWFENEGIPLTTQPDQCVFPRSQDAMQIVDTLQILMRRAGVKVVCNCDAFAKGSMQQITGRNSDEAFVTAWLKEQAEHLTTGQVEDRPSTQQTALVIATGTPHSDTLRLFFAPYGIKVTPTLPSLFTFCLGDEALHALMGTVVEHVVVRLTGTKWQAEGALLITHWGFSGPAILRLSSYAAVHLASSDYQAELAVNWLGGAREDEAADLLQHLAAAYPQRLLANQHPPQLMQRHWVYLLQKAGLSPQKRWQELGPKQTARLASLICCDLYKVTGRGENKEEFVTCGGIALDNLNPSTLECRHLPHLYFAGEVCDVDAVTGGFNLQAAWTMGYVVARSIAQLPAS